MIPPEFEKRLQQIFTESDAARVLASMRDPKAIALWENPLARHRNTAVMVAQLCNDLQLPATTAISAQLPGCWQVPADQRDAIMRHPAVSAGDIYPINPSSLFAALALDVQPGDEVLDLAAAPGGKSLVLAAALAPEGVATGRLALVEPVKPRFFRLRANMERCGVLQADYYQRDGRGVGAAVGERFDRVLLDAPCSSEARFHVSNPDSFTHWSLRKVRECARKQKSLLRSAFRALKPGGTLVYCTCSFAPEENEKIVASLLRREATARLLPVAVSADVAARVRNGLTHWDNRLLDCDDALRVLPDTLWDGFFLAKISKRTAPASG